MTLEQEFENDSDHSSTVAQKVSSVVRSPSLELFKKSFKFDLFSPLKFLGSVFLITVIPLALLLMLYSEPDPTGFILTGSIELIYFLVFTLALPLIVLISTVPLISKEFSDGTILVLDSYPLSRGRIVLCKFTAAYLYCILLCFTSFGIITFSLYFNSGFHDLWAFFLVNIGVSLLFTFFLVSLFLGISAFTTKPRIGVFTGFLVVLYFIILGIIPSGLYSVGPDTSLYADLHVYLFDLNYNTANIYVWLINQFRLFPFKTTSQIIFPHIFDSVQFEVVPTNYLLPIVSLVILVSVGLTVLLIGYIRFRFRELL